MLIHEDSETRSWVHFVEFPLFVLCVVDKNEEFLWVENHVDFRFWVVVSALKKVFECSSLFLLATVFPTRKLESMFLSHTRPWKSEWPDAEESVWGQWAFVKLEKIKVLLLALYSKLHEKKCQTRFKNIEVPGCTLHLLAPGCVINLAHEYMLTEYPVMFLLARVCVAQFNWIEFYYPSACRHKNQRQYKWTYEIY